MFYRQGLTSALVALLATASVQATVLTYDFSGSPGVADDAQIPADYGDNVTGASMAGGAGTYGYSNFGEGFTPNVTADHGDAQFYGAGYGDLTNVAYADDGTFSLTLSTGVTQNVTLFSFDLAGFASSYQINSVSVFANGVQVFLQNNVTVNGSSNGTGRTSFTFSQPFRGNTISLNFDASNLGANALNVGIDNIQFGQAVPEPSSVVLALSAAGLALVVRRFRRS